MMRRPVSAATSGRAGPTTLLASVATTPGASIVPAVGFSGVTGSQNPFALRHG